MNRLWISLFTLGSASVAFAGWLAWLPALVLAGIGTFVSATLLIAWWREGRDYLPAKSLLMLPLYALWKVPMYAGLLRKGAPSEWVRTDRSPEAPVGWPAEQEPRRSAQDPPRQTRRSPRLRATRW